MMSDNKDNQVATTSKEIRAGGNSVEAEMDEVMNAVDEEMRNTENNPEEEELMVSLDSRSLNRSRKKFQKRKLSQQLSTTPLKIRKINWWWPHSQDVFFLSSSVQVKQKEWKKIRFLPKSVSAYHYHSGTSCAVLRKWGTIWSVEWKTEDTWTEDMTWEKTSTWSSKPLNWQFTPGSTSCLMVNGHCILRREEWPWVLTNGKKTEKDHTFIWRQRARTKDNGQ